jgi:hypothetical protein
MEQHTDAVTNPIITIVPYCLIMVCQDGSIRWVTFQLDDTGSSCHTNDGSNHPTSDVLSYYEPDPDLSTAAVSVIYI